MFARVTTVAFEGIEARGDVLVQIGPGLPAFTIVGRPDKAVAESPSGCAGRSTRFAVWPSAPDPAAHRRL